MNTAVAIDARTENRHIPGEAGIWVFIGGDIVVFSLFFITFLIYRLDAPAIFQASQALLNQQFGMLNTLLMLTSSWFVAMGVNAFRRGLKVLASWAFCAALLCGLGFVIVKGFEYAEKITADITVNSNDFFMFYFMFTGIHLVHVIIGMGVLTFLAAHARGSIDPQTRLRNLESGASFWHLVDLLWIVLFALFYLVH